MWNLLQLSILLASASVLHASPRRTAESYIEVPDEMSNGTLYSISDFSPKVFVRTDEFELNSTSCVQFNYKLAETRVRLRAYNCLMGENGYCVLDKYYFPKFQEGCASMRPWYKFNKTWSFYFVLERRERKYGKNKKRRLRKRSNGRISAKPYGELELFGVVPCKEVCKDRKVEKPDENQINRIY